MSVSLKVSKGCDMVCLSNGATQISFGNKIILSLCMSISKRKLESYLMVLKHKESKKVRGLRNWEVSANLWILKVSPDLSYGLHVSLRDLGGHQERLIISWKLWSSELKACQADLCVFSRWAINCLSAVLCLPPQNSVIWISGKWSHGWFAACYQQTQTPQSYTHTCTHSYYLLPTTATLFMPLHQSPAVNGHLCGFSYKESPHVNIFVKLLRLLFLIRFVCLTIQEPTTSFAFPFKNKVHLLLINTL